MTVGQIAGNYKVLEKIGEGGMGEVYKGIDVMLEREVAIKVLRPELAHQPDVVERFRSEAKLLARLNHPNIATLYSFQRQGNDLLMVMEFVPGEPLDAYLAHAGRMPPEQAIPLFCNALNGIEHAHTMGVVHRDIKPANVMLTRDASVKVMDFGIARALGAARMTRTGRLIGTLEYMAPEQVRGEAGDTRSDMYALGILLYEMLTGQVPFESDSDYGVMRAQIEAQPTPPRTLVPDLPGSLEHAILTALEKEPDARFASVALFREAVQAALGTHALPTAAAKTAVPPPTRMAPVPDPLLDAAEQDIRPKATRAASSDEMVSAAASLEPKRTRVAGSQEAAHARAPKGTRLATPPDAVHAPEEAAGERSFPPASLLARLGTKQYAGAAALLLVVLILVLVWPKGTTPPVDPTSEVDPVAEVNGNNEGLDQTTTPTSRPLQPPPDQPSLQPDLVQPLISTQELLDQAENFFANNQLTTPPGENALDYARRVLMMDPLNAEANLLIRRIADRYEGWGDDRMQRGEYEQALTFYESSLAVRPDNPNVTRKITAARTALGGPRQRIADESTRAPETPSVTPVVPERVTVSVSAGTPVRVRLAETIAAVNGDKKGDVVRFTVSEDVVVDGRVVIGRGARATGRVTHVRRAKTLRRGEVRFTIQSAKAVDGTTIQLQTQEIEVKAARGRDALVRQGTLYTVTVAQRAQVRTL